MKNIYLVTLLLSTVIALAACGQKNNKSAYKAAPPGASQSAKPSSADAQSEPGDILIEGATYVSPCAKIQKVIGGIELHREQIEFSKLGGTFSKKTNYFATEDCDLEAVAVLETGEVDSPNRSLKMPAALDENFNFETKQAIVENPILVETYNRAHICGFTDWTLGEPKNILDALVASSDTTPSSECLGKPTPRTEMVLMLVENHKLYFGSGNDTMVRPTTVDRSQEFSKK